MNPKILLIKAVFYVRRDSPRLWTYIKTLGWKRGSIASAVVIVAIGGIVFATRQTAPAAFAIPSEKTVRLKSVAELSSQSSPLSIVGQVTSKSEATVRSERSGQVVAIYKALGDSISAGTVVAEIENASERAAVLQAEAGVDAAEANLMKVTGGARSEQLAILELGVTNASASLQASRSTALNAILSAYATADSSVHSTADKMFTNPGKTGSTFNIISSDSQLTNRIENMRNTVEQYLTRQEFMVNTLTSASDLDSELVKAQEEMREIRTFLDMIVSALNKGISSGISGTTIAAHLAEATVARSSLSGSLAALSGAVQGIASSESVLAVSKKNLEQGIVGGQAEDVAAARAALKQAQGGLAAARANLQKTIIRAPISGTINSFSLKRGDYVQMSSPVLTVANNGALEVVAYVSEVDARELAVGQKATLDQAIGVVTRIAQALDPLTKKIEVRVGVSDPTGLINGQSVLVAIQRTSALSGSVARITIPIAAIKVESDREVVFGVTPQNTLIAYPVVLGALLGERVVVASGISGDMNIVIDARGLREGERVKVQ